jgi:Ca2+-binding RTX toxin-like protein
MGSPSDDYFERDAGNVTINAFSGNDAAYGGSGNDLFYGLGGMTRLRETRAKAIRSVVLALTEYDASLLDTF